MTLKIPSSSKEFINIAVVSDSDPTPNTVKIAFTADLETEPVANEWNTATWKPGQTIQFVDNKFQEAWTCRILVGGVGSGATAELAEGDWVAWAMFDDGMQRMVRPAGKFKVT